MIKLILLSVCFAVYTCVNAQLSFLMLEKKNRGKNAYYKSGDIISFRAGERKNRITGEIVSINDSTIVFKGFEIRVGDIKSLYIDDKTKWWLRYKVQQLCLVGGGGYLLLDTINHGELHENTLLVSGALIGIGLLAKALIGNRIKIQGRTKLRIIELI